MACSFCVTAGRTLSAVLKALQRLTLMVMLRVSAECQKVLHQIAFHCELLASRVQGGSGVGPQICISHPLHRKLLLPELCLLLGQPQAEYDTADLKILVAFEHPEATSELVVSSCVEICCLAQVQAVSHPSATVDAVRCMSQPQCRSLKIRSTSRQAVWKGLCRWWMA